MQLRDKLWSRAIRDSFRRSFIYWKIPSDTDNQSLLIYILIVIFIGRHTLENVVDLDRNVEGIHFS